MTILICGVDIEGLGVPTNLDGDRSLSRLIFGSIFILGIFNQAAKLFVYNF